MSELIEEIKPKEKVILKPRMDLKPSEVLRQAQGRFTQVRFCLCKQLPDNKKGYCAIGVLGFEKGARPNEDDTWETSKGHKAFRMNLNNKQIGMSGIMDLYGVPEGLSSEIYYHNDAEKMTYTEIADWLEKKGY